MIFALLQVLNFGVQAKSLTRVAVLDFEVNSNMIDKNAGAIVADSFGFKVHKSGCYEIVNRNAMKRVLEEHEVNCNFIGCADVLGELLDVQKIFAGSVGKLGDTYTINVVLIDVNTTKEENSEYRSAKGKIDALLEIAGDMADYFCPDVGGNGGPNPLLPDGFAAVKDSPIDSTTGLPSEIECLKDKSRMALVNAGEFTMGSKFRKDEKPVHTVYLDNYYIDKYEVTVSQYKKFCKATGYNMWKQPDWNKSNHPVVYVRYKDAVAYCEWSGKRVPTEAEWEKAAAGTDGMIFPWGNTNVTGKRANFCDTNCEKRWKTDISNDFYTHTAPVGSYEDGKSAYGCYDMAGNVSEWCSDWYKKDYYKMSGLRNPIGVSSGTYRVVRGGSCYHMGDEIRSSYRGFNKPLEINPNRLIGFRCVVNP